MKLIKNKNYLFFVFYGIMSILFGAVEWLYGASPTGGTPGLSQIIAGAFTTVLIYVTFLALMDVMWSANLIDLGDFFLIFPRPDITPIFSRYMSIIGVAIISVVALRIYFDRKGDVE